MYLNSIFKCRTISSSLILYPHIIGLIPTIQITDRYQTVCFELNYNIKFQKRMVKTCQEQNHTHLAINSYLKQALK